MGDEEGDISALITLLESLELEQRQLEERVSLVRRRLRQHHQQASRAAESSQHTIESSRISNAFAQRSVTTDPEFVSWTPPRPSESHPPLVTGDRVFIDNAVRRPRNWPSSRAWSPTRERTATVRRIVGDRVDIVTGNGHRTWRLRKNLIHVPEGDAPDHESARSGASGRA